MPIGAALAYSFMFGLLHGILPDEHTWPITFSYAIGGASGREGMRAGLFFSAAFTLQRTLLSEVAYLALAPFLLSPVVNGIVYLVVGAAMSIAGAIVLRRNRYPHVHVLGHCHGEACETETSVGVLARQHTDSPEPATAPPVHWTLIHGFIAGFGFGGFSLFINTVAAPAMGSPWLGFLPGLLYGLGTTIMLVLIGALWHLWHHSTAGPGSWPTHRRRVRADRAVYDCGRGPGLCLHAERGARREAKGGCWSGNTGCRAASGRRRLKVGDAHGRAMASCRACTGAWPNPIPTQVGRCSDTPNPFQRFMAILL
jgi:cytochrome c biogenesis protein CcdA